MGPQPFRAAALVVLAAAGSPAAQDDPAAVVRAALGDALAVHADAPLDRGAAEELLDRAWAAWRGAVGAAFLERVPPLPPTVQALRAMDDDQRRAQPSGPWSIRVGELEMPFHLLRREGADAAEPRALFLCLHGGGQSASAEGPHAWDVNTREWRAQTMLAARVYPAEGLFLVPRMADDRLGRWWHRHNQVAFDRLIQVALACWGVDPDRVFLLGISEGGYGTDILAPFMADRFAGANAMAAGVDPAGNPPANLRNLPFRTDVGAEDTTYDRVGLARRFHAELDALHAADAGGYDHVLAEQEGRGHGIDYRPGVAWLAGRRRTPWPKTVTWDSRMLHGVRRPAFSWLGLDAEADTGPVRIDAHLDRDAGAVDVTVTPARGLTLRVMLRDEMLDLERPVVVRVNGAQRFEGRVPRTARNLVDTLVARGDPQLAFPAVVTLALDD